MKYKKINNSKNILEIFESKEKLENVRTDIRNTTEILLVDDGDDLYQRYGHITYFYNRNKCIIVTSLPIKNIEKNLPENIIYTIKDLLENIKIDNRYIIEILVGSPKFTKQKYTLTVNDKLLFVKYIGRNKIDNKSYSIEKDI